MDFFSQSVGFIHLGQFHGLKHPTRFIPTLDIPVLQAHPHTVHS